MEYNELLASNAALNGEVLRTREELFADLDEHRRKKRPASGKRAGYRELPDHLPRRTVVHQPEADCSCGQCGGGMREIGQDVSEADSPGAECCPCG